MYCHMTSLGACGRGGWTLVMKITGAQVYYSIYVYMFMVYLKQHTLASTQLATSGNLTKNLIAIYRFVFICYVICYEQTLKFKI